MKTIQSRPSTSKISCEPDTLGIERLFATGLVPVDRELSSMDPADRLTFVRPHRAAINRFDTRTDEILRATMFDHDIPMERERAFWEFADRHPAASYDDLREISISDAEPCLRWSALWAIQKHAGSRALDAICGSMCDDHDEVREWAKLFFREITGERTDPDLRQVNFDSENQFDQTLPLLIAGYARVQVPQLGWYQVTLSPLWFEHILGRVMACTKVDTFGKDLVIEKRLKDYHADGSSHYEIYKFRGFTFNPDPNVTEHIYECQSRHTFYPSGKVEDVSLPPFGDVDVILNRKAMPIVVPPARPIRRIPHGKGSMGRDTLPRTLVQSVRGRFMGSAFVNTSRILSQGMIIGPGEVQLASLHHPIVGPMTNTFLFGTFKGKLSDLNGDGALDLNTEPCHGTINGELDYQLTGAPNADPFDPFAAV